MDKINKILGYICVVLILIYAYQYATLKEYFGNEFDESSCYVSGNRPFVIDGRTPNYAEPPYGSTTRCVLKGGPQSWEEPVWSLPVSDMRNPAYYNQFPNPI